MQSTQSDDLHVQIVHTGPTKCIHAPKSAHVDRLFTGGDDYLVRILPTLPLPGVEPHLIEDATEPITSLDADGRFLVTASEDGSVRLYRHHPVDSEGNATSPTVLQSLLRREALPLRCVALERSVASGKAPRVAVCSDELIVKIIDVEDPRRIQLLDGHQRGLRAASWSPVAPLLVTCSTDGVARVTDLSDVEPKFVKSIEGILPTTRAESDEAVGACWHPSGTYFVMPSKAHELVVISAANDSSAWSRTGSFYAGAAGPVPAPSGSVTALAFSPNGRYLASATSNGQVTVWDAESRQAIKYKRADALVNAISWHPTKDALAWTDNEGSLARWSDVVGSTRPSPFEEITFDVSKAARGSRGRIDDIFAGTGLSDDEDDDAPARSQRDGGDANDLDDFVVDDDSRGYGGADPYSRHNARGGPGMAGGRDGGMMIAATRPQPAFQSTSTPMRGQRRYLAYNLLGSVVAVKQESHQTISFESFDTSARRNFRFSDMNNICMADLAKQGILFGAKQSAEQSAEQSSSVFFKPFVAATNNLSSEWTFNLDQGEDVEAVGLGGSGLRVISEDGWEDQDAGRSGVGIAVVATSKGYLRFLSASGMQLYLWAIGHPVVTLVVGARSVLVVYRRTGLPSGGFQDLGYKVIDLSNFDVIQDDVLPLAKDAHVRWVGYNDQHQPAFYDSTGTLFVLDRAHRSRQGRWVPSLDTKRIRDGASAEASDAAMRAASTLGYWPVALTSSKLMVLLLKGGRSYPEVDGTRHMIQELELQVPLIHREGGTGPLEEKSLRDSMLAMTARDVKNAGIEDDTPLDANTLEMSSDKALLQLIQLACKADKHGRALDAARALHSTRTLEAALKIAAFFHLSSLAERMVALKEGLEGRPERVEEESRRWCDPMVRGGPSYTNLALVDVMIRASSEGGMSSASVRKRASAALGEDFLPPSRLASGVLREQSEQRFESPSAPMSRSSAPQPADDSYSFIADDDANSSLSKENHYKRKTPEEARTLIMPNKAAKLNPFARTSSNVKDKQQMHKSTSFFERIEPYEKENLKGSNAPGKQSLLTGFVRKDRLPVEAASGVFGETQFGDEDGGDESLQATLERAARANGKVADAIRGDALPETMPAEKETGDSMDLESAVQV